MSSKTLAQLFACFAVVALSLAPAGAHAIVIQGNTAASTDHTGSTFEATLTYAPTSPILATLTVDLTNTTPAAVGGLLTGFVMNNPDPAKIMGISSFSTNTSFTQLGLSAKAENGAPFGQFDLGAALGGDWQGGGSPNSGLAATQTGTFVFTFSGTGLDTLTDQSFVTAPSTGPGMGQGAQFFVARFRGLPNDGSDKVPAMAVPEPATSALLLAGLLAVGGLVARRGRG